MTEEQIKQNAEEYASKVAPAKIHKTGIPAAINHAVTVSFIAGAHSRDEEIKQLRKALSSAQQAMAELAEMARSS